GTPLTINVTTGANFTATGRDFSIESFVVFNDFWNNTLTPETPETSNTATTATVSLDNLWSTPLNTGSSDEGAADQEDLVLGFQIWDTYTDGDTVALTTGTRVTGNLSLNYTSINASGTAFLIDGEWDTVLSSPGVTWSTVAVPEPSTYAAISGLVCLGGAIARRRFKRS
ncbi:PEP-CTERM sorting domain-containing protein, partial [bacterium]|nr:PEP-CTERM sorting domain-containing protein [bacterium]